MKKLSTLLLCAGLLFSMSACSKKDPVDDKALDKLVDVFKQTTKMKSTSYTLDIETAQDKVKTTAKAAGSVVLGEKPQISLVMDVTANGQTAEDFADFYLFDNTTYINLMGNKMKGDAGDFSLKSDSEEITQLTKMDKKILREYIKEASIDGKTIVLKFNVKKLNTEMTKATQDDNMVSGLMSSGEYKSMKLTFKYDDKNYLTSLQMDGSLNVDSMGEKVSSKVKIALKLSDLNRIIDIDLPTNLNDYQEMNSALSGLDEQTPTDDTTDGGL